MKLGQGIRSIACVLGTICGAASYSEAATINAASCSLTAVQAAVNAAVDGDKVVIPNGSCAWAGGISTTKQIRIEAQNYTPHVSRHDDAKRDDHEQLDERPAVPVHERE